jgi:three-Cys-motif partner protein
MPVEDKIGYGELTEVKTQHFARIIAMHLAITQAVLNRNPHFGPRYRYVDMTAGKGYTPNGFTGSPLLFLEKAESYKFRKAYRADFIEQNEGNLEELKRNVGKLTEEEGWRSPDVHYHHGKYEQVIPSLFRAVDWREMGLVFVDPSGTLPNFGTLKTISSIRPKMEILVYLSTTNVKRVYHTKSKLLSDHIGSINKKHWLVRRPFTWDQHKWTFLLGSNTDIFKSYKSIDFLRLDSKEAQQFFPTLDLSAKQRMEKKQPRLFD